MAISPPALLQINTPSIRIILIMTPPAASSWYWVWSVRPGAHRCNHGHANPTFNNDGLMKYQHGQKRLCGVAEGAGRHDITVVRPAYRTHITKCVSKQEEDGQPDRAILYSREEGVPQPIK